MLFAPVHAGSCSRLMPVPSTSGRHGSLLWPHTPSLVPRPHTCSRDARVQVVARAARVAKSSDKGRKTRRTLQAAPALPAAPSEEDILRLNVGGTTIHTARSTLLQFPGSVLHDMFRRENEHLLLHGNDGTVFLDMDPEMFQQVLRFMREARMRGYPDATLSSFKEDDRPHLALLLHHLRLLDDSCVAQTSRSSQAVSAAAAHQDQSNSKKKRKQQQTGSQPAGASPLATSPSPSSSTANSSMPVPRPPGCSPASQGSSRPAAVPPSTCASPSPQAQPAVQSTASFTSPSSSSTSQMYFIQAQCDPRRGMKISVYTEGDLVNVAPSERFEIFCNVSASRSELSFTFVCRQDFDDVFLGITTREHIDRKGSVVPCFGWKANSRVYNTPESRSAAVGAAQQAQSSQRHGLPLWGKGDSVELIVSLPPIRSTDGGSESGVGGVGAAPSMAIKVNGRELDRISNLPMLKDWCWYVALEMGGDVSCVSLMEDSYAVFWQDYVVKRFLS